MGKLVVSKKGISAANDHKRIEPLYLRITKYIDTARRNVQKTIDSEMVSAYWQIGREIVEEEQK